jgi:hypothetical protein
MKKYGLIVFWLFVHITLAQKPEKIRFPDLEFKKLGMQVKVESAVSTPEYIKCKLTLTNKNDFFVIADATKFYFIVNGKNMPCREKLREIPMNAKRAFGTDAKGKDMNAEMASLVVDGLTRTANHKIIEFPDVNALKKGKTDFTGVSITVDDVVNEENIVRVKINVKNTGHSQLIFNPSVIELRDQNVPVNNSKPRVQSFLLKKDMNEYATLIFNVSSNKGEKQLIWNDALVSAESQALPPFEIALISNKNLLSSFKYTIKDVPEDFEEKPAVAATVNPIPVQVSEKKINETKPEEKQNTNPTVKKEELVFRGDGENSELHAADINYQNPGKYYALLIGVSDYSDPSISDLDSLPLKDAGALANTLTTYYTFSNENVKVLNNPTRREMVIALDELSRKATPLDNVLIFYAGHGHYEDENDIGYWLPKDAEVTNSSNWMYNDQLVASIRKIKSLHTLLISDACFSGSIFKNRAVSMENATDIIKKKYELPSRRALTSGTLKTVPNRSVFIKYVVDRLNNNKDPFFSASQLYQAIEAPVGNNSSSLPQFGVIQNVGDEGGDFIFIKKP